LKYNLGNILIIKNDYVMDPELLSSLKQTYQVDLVEDVADGIDTLSDDESYHDIFVIMSKKHIDETTEEFLQKLAQARTMMTPVIFVSEEQNKALISGVSRKSSWYFSEYPIDHEVFMEIMEDAMILANMSEDKSIVFERNGLKYPVKQSHIFCIERNGARKIKIYVQDQRTLDIKIMEFSYRASLSKLIEEHGIGKWFKQAQQSWLVNMNWVRDIDKNKMVITLINGTVISTSKLFVDKLIGGEDDGV